MCTCSLAVSLTGWGLSGCASAPESPPRTISAAPVHVAPKPVESAVPLTGLAGAQARYLEARVAFREAATAVERSASRYDTRVGRAARASRSSAGLANVDPKSITSRAEAQQLKARARNLEANLRSYQRSEKSYRRAVARYDEAEEALARARAAYEEAMRRSTTADPSERPTEPGP